MFVAVVVLDIQIGEGNSLKVKRKVLRSIIDRVKSKFNVSVAEVGDNDLWQRTKIGFAVVSNDKTHANSAADKIMEFFYSIPDINIIDTQLEIINAGTGDWGLGKVILFFKSLAPNP